ncbi:PAC2 family-domain-containing protein [Dichotomocladium elegans]|nr:PAC2 family-domain-containing protein [Dichotomocladium elegans]
MDSFVASSSFNSNLLAGSTLVLPAVSIGNVPQLTSDLFIHTLQLNRVGFIDNDALMPVAGAREGRTGSGVSVAVEVFQTSDHKWTVIQQRAPTFKGKRGAYVKDLVAFIQKYKFQSVILLTSADAGLRTDAQITGSIPLRVIGTDKNMVEKASAAGIPTLETDENQVHGTGIGVPLFKALKEAQVLATMFIMFALEGDNVSDAILFANALNTLLEFKTDKGSWTPPKSWDFLFGNPYNQELYQ